MRPGVRHILLEKMGQRVTASTFKRHRKLNTVV